MGVRKGGSVLLRAGPPHLAGDTEQVLTTYTLKALRTPRIPNNFCKFSFLTLPIPATLSPASLRAPSWSRSPGALGILRGNTLLPLRPSQAPGTAGIQTTSGPHECSLTWGAQSGPRTSRAITGLYTAPWRSSPGPAGARMVLGRKGGRGSAHLCRASESLSS